MKQAPSRGNTGTWESVPISLRHASSWVSNSVQRVHTRSWESLGMPVLRHANTASSVFTGIGPPSAFTGSNPDSTKVVIERILQSEAPSNLTSPVENPTRLSCRCSNENLGMDLLNNKDLGLMSRVRCFLMRVIFSQSFEFFAGCVILCNFIVICSETNARVMQGECEKGSAGYNDAKQKLYVYDRINFAFLMFYFAECVLRLFIQGRAFFNHKWNLFDLAIVCTGIVGEVMESILGSSDSASMEHFQILRSMRMLRLLRAARVIISFKELYSLICGLSSCLKTLFWAAGLVFLLLTMWSILSVEYLHPLIRQLAEEGHYADCSYCADAFKDIMNANLTLFQIISGDGWGQISRPLIIHHPWTAVIIVCIIFTMVFGMLNLITAVIVDTAAQARQLDVMHMGKQKEHERQEAWTSFAELCLRLDENRDGEISLEELKKGIQEVPELSAHLSVLGVEEEDLSMVFDILDANQDGKITHKEFIRQLYKIQTYELRSAHCFMKHYVEDIRRHVKMLVGRTSSWELGTSLPNLQKSDISFNEANQPEPELFPPRSPPQDPQMPSIEAPSEESDVSDWSSSLVSVETGVSGKSEPPTVPEHSVGGGDKESCGSPNKLVADSSHTPHEVGIYVPSLDDSVMQHNNALSKSLEKSEDQQLPVYWHLEQWQEDSAKDLRSSSVQLRGSFTKELDELSGQIQSDVITQPQDDQDAELPGALSMEPQNGQDPKFPRALTNHFDLERGGPQKSPSSGSPFRIISTK